MAKRADPPDSAIDDRLVERAREGNQKAWADLVRELGPVVRGLARAKGVPDPDDLTQDVFVAVATRIAEFEGDASDFRSWLFSIAYRKIVDRWRKHGREPTTAVLPSQMADRSHRGPEDVAVTAAVAVDALAALDTLNDTERDVVLLRILAGLGTAEVAAVVGKRRGNVRVIQSRALQKLRSTLKRRGYGGADDVELGGGGTR